MMCKKFWCFLCFLLFVHCVHMFAQEDSFEVKKLDAYIKKSMASWEVPGMAIAIVKDRDVPFIRGYGVSSIETKEPVDEETIFPIASCTKAFTSAALMILQEEKKLTLDDKVIAHLQDFQLVDPHATREVTLRDLLLHRSGLGGPDLFLWYGTPFNRKEILDRIRYLPLRCGFRTRFQYSNLMYIAAGEVIPTVTSESWDTFIEKKLFVPLEMKRSLTSSSLLKNKSNVASPHQKVGGVIKPVYRVNTDNEGPAASIHSTALDMSKWIRMLLQGGVYKGHSNHKKSSIDQLFTPQVYVTNDTCKKFRPPEARFLSYGLGWYWYEYHGTLIIDHAGCIDGMGALVVMVPEKNLGVVVLTNRLLNGLPFSITNHILDIFLKIPEHNWDELLHQSCIDFEKIREKEIKKIEQDHILYTAPSLPLKQYVGSYHNNFATAHISLQNELLFLDVLGFHYPLNHWHFDTFQFDPHKHFPLLPNTNVTFTVDHNGKVASFKLTSAPWIDSEWKKHNP